LQQQLLFWIPFIVLGSVCELRCSIVADKREKMNALFPPVPEREALVRQQHGIRDVVVNQELRFNGDVKAFLNCHFQDFINLLSGNVFG
jgi:hypothetical protein